MDGIGTIVADRICADINTRAGTGGSNLTLLRTRSGSSANIFRGSLVTTSVVGTVTNHGIRVYGELDADITVHQDVTRPIIVSGQLNPGRTLTIAGSMLTSGSSTGRLEIGTLAGSVLFTSNSVGPQGNITFGSVASTGQLRILRGFPSGYATSTTSGPMAGLIRIGRGLAGNMSFPANGLQGQVIIDAEMVGAAWTGNVTIGSTTISHTNGIYTNLPSTLGGGAVGLAPFQLHETACTPPHNQVGTPGSIIETTSFANDGDVPVIITIWFAMDPAADFDGMNGVDVPDIFASLTAWFQTNTFNC